MTYAQRAGLFLMAQVVAYALILSIAHAVPPPACASHPDYEKHCEK